MSAWEPIEETAQPVPTSSAPTQASDTSATSPNLGDYWTETAFREGGKEQTREEKPGSEWGRYTMGKPATTGRLNTAPRQEGAKPTSVVDDWEAETFREDRKPATRTAQPPPPSYDHMPPRPAVSRDNMPRMQRAPRRDTGYDQWRGPQEPQYAQTPSYPGPRDQWQTQSFQAASRPIHSSQRPSQFIPSYREPEASAEDWGAAAFRDIRQMPRRPAPMNQDYSQHGQDAYRANRATQPLRQDPVDRNADSWGVPVFKNNSYKEQEAFQGRQPAARGDRNWDLPERYQPDRTDFPPSATDNGKGFSGYYMPQGEGRPYSRPVEGQPMSHFTAPRGPPYRGENNPRQMPRSDFRTNAYLENNDYITNPHSDKDFFAEDIPINPEMLSQDSHFHSDRTWDSFNFPAPLLAAIQQSGYEFPSKIQEMSFDLLMAGQYEHVVVQAPTGSGKTLAFVLPTLTLIDSKCQQPQVMVVAPTLELLNQLTEEYTKYAKTMGISVGYVKGRFEPSQVVLMTPRQCAFLFQAQPASIFSNLKFTILDEADHLLDKEDQMESAMNVGIVVKQLPSTCHVLCFSATYSTAIQAGLEDLLGDYSEIMVKKEDLVLDNIKMYYVKRGIRETKLDLLERILEGKASGVTLIFVNTVKFAQVLSGVLTRRGLKCALLAGRNITIDERVLTVQDFKRGFYDIVVSTNLLARGIDNTHITRVINFDIPNHWTTHLVDTETYLHRIGRAGRFSRTGEAITIVGSEAELKMVEEVMRHYGCVIEQLSMEKEAQ